MKGACVLVLLVFPLQHSSLGDSSPLSESWSCSEKTTPHFAISSSPKLDWMPLQVAGMREQAKSKMDLVVRKLKWSPGLKEPDGPAPFSIGTTPLLNGYAPSQSTSPVWFSVNAEESGHDIL